MNEITFLALAESDFIRLYADAENRSLGGGDRFSDEVEKLLGLLARLPRIGRVVGAPYRRLKLSQFPYSLLYVIEGRRLFIHCVASNYEPLEMLRRRLREGSTH